MKTEAKALTDEEWQKAWDYTEAQGALLSDALKAYHDTYSKKDLKDKPFLVSLANPLRSACIALHYKRIELNLMKLKRK